MAALVSLMGGRDPVIIGHWGAGASGRTKLPTQSVLMWGTFWTPCCEPARWKRAPQYAASTPGAIRVDRIPQTHYVSL